VNILTPVKIAGSDSAILVNRGWVYAPDAMTVDLQPWREPDSVSGEAYVENYQTRSGVPRSRSRANGFRWADRAAISQAIPYPIAPYYLVLIGEKSSPNVPPRVEVPPLDEGPHQSYAMQWFSFATISIVGMILYTRRK
jgi:surfeit locus 1 family protein